MVVWSSGQLAKFCRTAETGPDGSAHLAFAAVRFDVGSGMATIRDPNPIKLGEFHTVELHRNHTLGYIVVDGGEPINGSSQVPPTTPSDPLGPAANTRLLSAGQVPGAGFERGAARGRLPQLHSASEDCGDEDGLRR